MTYIEAHRLRAERERNGLWNSCKLGLIIAAILCLLVIVEGCSPGGSKTQAGLQAQVDKPAAAIAAHDPYVLIIGDQLVTAWKTPEVAAANPQWFFAGSAPGVPYETSGQVLARFPGALVAANPADPGHPDLVVILVGTFDTAAPSWTPPCGAENTGQALTISTCTDITTMIELAQQAGSKVLVCTLPTTNDGPSAGSAGSQLLAANPDMQGNESLFDRNLPLAQGNGGWTEQGVVDIAGAANGMQWTDDGVTPNAQGAELFTSVVQAAILGLKTGYAR